MPFDFDRFKTTDWQPRTKEIAVTNLKQFFKKKEKPVFKIRNLTAEELARARDAESKNNAQLKRLVESLLYAEEATKAGILKDIQTTINTMVPGDLAYRHEVFFHGVMDPKFPDKSDVVFFAKHQPISFYEITNEIFNITDMGSNIPKSKPIGEAKTSS